MAPALTEPLSPTENITSSPVTASSTPNTRSSRKLDSSSVANKSDSTPKNFIVKSAPPVREKRIRSGPIIINQTPSSSKRVTRFRDNLQRNTLTPNSTLNGDNITEFQQITAKRISKSASVQEVDRSVLTSSINSLDRRNEQMGLSAVPLNNKNKILNINSNTNTSTSKNLVAIDDNTKEDTSTAQLLADLTNEAITAEICLRNQLKDVNLVKTSGDPSSPIIQQDTFVDTDTDIVVLKGTPHTITTASEINKSTTAHMEAQLNESKSSNCLDTTDSEQVEGAISAQNHTAEEIVAPKGESDNLKQEENRKVEDLVDVECQHDENEQKKDELSETIATENYMDTGETLQETSVDSPHSLEDNTEAKKTTNSKLEILSVQELPPVSTDSTMTASEVEDNLEERLSQLDGTAIDSPPPNNHDLDSTDKSNQTFVADASPINTTATHEQTLSNDLQDLQQQLQHTPPNLVDQQVESDHLETLQQHQQQPQQMNCFTTPQSIASPISLLGNVSSNMAQSFIKESDNVGVGAAAELEDQDIEEVFKVLKGFEGGTTSDLNVCDLNVLFNEVYMKINETELGGNAGSGGSIASAISPNAQSHVAVTNPSIQLVKPTKMEEGQMEIGKRQQQMQRKTDFLMRRLRKLQARYMCKHTSEEIAGLFEWTARQASKGITNTASLDHNENSGAPDPSKCFLKVISARPPASDWKDVHEALVPANQITTLLRKIESVANAQQLCTTPSVSLVNITHKKTKKAMMEAQSAAAATAALNSSSIGASSFNESKAEEVVVATLEENVADELAQVAGLLQVEMSEVQKAIDSDATESSSGGESADEMVTYNNTQQQTLPITKRAAWRYSRDRAAIASRWSWLLSQISDLEIKIRQHSELHQEIIRSKGPVTCSSQVDTGEEVDEDLTGSCRTRGYVPSIFRKRKLIQTTNIHTISKKAARPSTIKCGCQWPLHPCALCTGRLDPTAPRDLPDTMMMSDRIALLDSGYHPVLSFRENVNNALHFEAIAKQPEWQQRVMRCQAKSIAKNVWKAERAAAAAGGHHSSSSKKYSEAPPTKRRYIKKKDRLHNDEKSGGKSSISTTAVIPQQQHAVTLTSTLASASAITSTATSPSTSATSLIDVGNGTANLSTTTTSTTPLVANKGMTNKHCPVMRDEILKDPSNSLLPPKCLTTTNCTVTTSSSAAVTSTTINNKKYIHQTSDCLPTNCDQFNPSQTPSSLISNNHNHNSSIKSNKHRKLSSSTVVNSHHYNHPNNTSNNLYNGGDTSYDYWGGAGENFNIRSRTSSPTHGSSGNLYHKYERSLDRKSRTSYDIDNIVIPYSVAAATRVEVLHYKEIPTPKWRVIDNDNEGVNISKQKMFESQESDLESSLDAKPIANGHVSDDNMDLESKKTNPTDNEKKSIENCTSVTAEEGSKEEKSKFKNVKESDVKLENKIGENVKSSEDDTEENVSCLASSPNSSVRVEQIKKKYKKSQSKSSSDDIKSDVDETIKEPQFKRIKIDSSVIDIKNESVENETENECSEEKITLQNDSKIIGIEEDENISDDAMFLRHEKALTEERRKFQTYLKFPWSTRSRANRRIDSRAESSGANTPDPSSPAPQTPSVGGGDLESIPSPLNPATPLNPLDAVSEAGDYSTSFLGVNSSLPSLSSKRYERRRTTSTKRDREVERRSSTPDSKELIPPYEPLTFPLTDEQFEELLRAMPSDHGEDCKRFDECYLPSGDIIGFGGGFSHNKYPRTISGTTSKRSSRASTMCGDLAITTPTAAVVNGRRVKNSNSKNLRPISADDSNIEDLLLYDDDYEDDYPKHHLAPNDDHLTADSVCVGNVSASNGLYVDDDDDIYGDQYGAYVGRNQRKHHGNSEGDSSEEEPFQDDDPNDPEWRGESEDRFRKKL